MRVEHQLWLKISEDSDAKDLLWAPDKQTATEVISNMQRMAAGKFNIAAGGTETLSFGDVDDARFVYVEADDDFNAALNGGAVLTIRRADDSSRRKARMALELDADSVSITNPSGTDALNGRYVIYGDPT